MHLLFYDFHWCTYSPFIEFFLKIIFTVISVEILYDFEVSYRSVFNKFYTGF
jgi:hypothetical protein